jgi:hypothetical protein
MRPQAENNEKKHHYYAYCRHRGRGGYAIGLVVNQKFSRIWLTKITELSHLLNKLKEYTHIISRYRMPVSADGYNWRSEK